MIEQKLTQKNEDILWFARLSPALACICLRSGCLPACLLLHILPMGNEVPH